MSEFRKFIKYNQKYDLDKGLKITYDWYLKNIFKNKKNICMIPLSAPTITGNETKHLGETIKKWISTYGAYKIRFDKSLSKITKSNFVISVSSGTAALHLALCVLGVKKRQEVIVPSMTFVASINVIKYLDANPVFMDVDNNHNLDVKNY